LNSKVWDRRLANPTIQASSFDSSRRNTEIKWTMGSSEFKDVAIQDGMELEQTLADLLAGPLPATELDETVAGRKVPLLETVASCIWQTTGYKLLKGEQKIAEATSKDHVLIMTNARLISQTLGGECQEDMESFYWNTLTGVTISLDTVTTTARLTLRSSRVNVGTRSWVFNSTYEEYAQMVSGFKFSSISEAASEVQSVPEWTTKAEDFVLQGQPGGTLADSVLETLKGYEILADDGDLSGWVASLYHQPSSLAWVTSGNTLLTMRWNSITRTVSSSVVKKQDAGAYWVRGETGNCEQDKEYQILTTLYQAPLTFIAKNEMTCNDVYGLLTFLKTLGS